MAAGAGAWQGAWQGAWWQGGEGRVMMVMMTNLNAYVWRRCKAQAQGAEALLTKVEVRLHELAQDNGGLFLSTSQYRADKSDKGWLAGWLAGWLVLQIGCACRKG